MSAIIAKSLDYSSAQVAHGTPNLSKITQQSGSTSVTIDVTGGNTSVFEISPDSVINFSKSFITMTATPSAPVAGSYNKMRVLGMPYIRAIQLVTREGLFLADIQDCHKYLSTVLPLNTSTTDFIEADTPSDAYGTATGINRVVAGTNSNLVVPSLAWVTADN